MYCTSLNNAGNACKAQSMQGTKHCYRHNPNIPQAEKIEASFKGGISKNVLKEAEPVTLRSIENIISLVESNVSAVRTGELDPKVSNAIVQNLNILLRVYELAIVDSRIRKLEQHAGIDSPSELLPDLGDTSYE